MLAEIITGEFYNLIDLFMMVVTAFIMGLNWNRREVKK